MSMMASQNKIVHGMWIGSELSKLELLTLHSFAHFGHEFHLWAYDDLSAYEFPRGVYVEDAEEIIPRGRVFAKKRSDRETGVGRNSYGAPFSDLFRYKLLLEHGGIWADMDVTCLRPFNFEMDYAFRPHRVGVVGSILKCPKDSSLMRQVYRETAASVSKDTDDYLLPNRILSRHVQRAGLEGCIVPNMSNPDSWFDFVRPLIERGSAIPDEWYAIHWINEMWRTLKEDNGLYRGQRLLDYVPDKDAARPGSTLWELYRKYGLVDPWQGPSEGSRAPVRLGRAPAPLPVASAKDAPRTNSHLNVLVPSLVRGGAERSVVEIMSALRKVRGLTQRLFVIHPSQRQYALHSGDNLQVVFGESGADVGRTMRAFANEILKSPSPVIFTHLVPAGALADLWAMGISTIPVVQNARPAWTDLPDAYDHPCVPFVVGVSEAVAAELRAAGCKRPIVPIRHELQRFFAPQDLARHRREIRDRHGIHQGTLLIGMVGQFKSQKAYTRAVRVLHALQEVCPAKLMILGGWDHDYGGGRAAYEATCRRAVELGVIADMIMPGDVNPIDPYLAAFDVFLNTSIYEGLSVALLEAIQTGCPIVTADAGGNREVLPDNGALVRDGSDIDAYVDAILNVAATRERAVRAPGADSTLVPRLWSLLAKHGVASSVSRPGPPSGTLFVTQHFAIGGPQQSLVNLLCSAPAPRKHAVCILKGQASGGYRRRLDEAQIQILLADDAGGLVETAEAILTWLDAFNFRNLCFWNAQPELKLLLAKVLAARKLRLIDVSPGKMLLDELKAAESFQRRITLGASQYFERLDRFVAKHESNVPPPDLCADRSKICIIPNGVAAPPEFIPLPPPSYLLPRDRDPAFAVGACCRIVPDKHIDFLLDAMKVVSLRSAKTTLTIVGGPDASSGAYSETLKARVRDEGLDNVYFVGEHEYVLPFLAQFRIFLMVAEREGCPNASLEAMAMGLPVIARQTPSASAQVKDGVNGYLVSQPDEMADRILLLQRNARLRRKLGRAGRSIARKDYAMARMVNSYLELLDGDGAGV